MQLLPKNQAIFLHLTPKSMDAPAHAEMCVAIRFWSVVLYMCSVSREKKIALSVYMRDTFDCQFLGRQQTSYQLTNCQLRNK